MNKMVRQCVQISRELGYIMFRVYNCAEFNLTWVIDVNVGTRFTVIYHPCVGCL